MVEFPWVPVVFKKIGRVYLPLCDVEIKSKYGRWITFNFKVDSSADMTLMQVYDCYTLGYTLGDCKHHFSSNINKEKFRTHVRNFDIRIGDDIAKDVPIAFSVKPIETLLLGRMKIFDNFIVCFDDIKKQTLPL